MAVDVHNTFIQTKLERKEGEERIIMKLTGVIVDMLVEDSPGIYGLYVVYNNNKNVSYVAVLMAIYEMLVSTSKFIQSSRKI